MGYTTDFRGEFEISPVMKPEHIAYINEFSGTRRMKRDANAAEALSDPIRRAVGLPIGKDGEYFVGNGDNNPGRVKGSAQYNEFAGQQHDSSIVDNNHPPTTQPSLWCQWVINADGKSLEWDGGEKFYSYTEWLEYFVDNFLNPWGYKLNGQIEWQGEDSGDMGRITADDNHLSVAEGTVTYGDE